MLFIKNIFLPFFFKGFPPSINSNFLLHYNNKIPTNRRMPNFSMPPLVTFSIVLVDFLVQLAVPSSDIILHCCPSFLLLSLILIKLMLLLVATGVGGGKIKNTLLFKTTSVVMVFVHHV